MRKTAAAGERKREGVPTSNMADGWVSQTCLDVKTPAFTEIFHCKLIFHKSFHMFTCLSLVSVKLNRFSLRNWVLTRNKK